MPLPTSYYDHILLASDVPKEKATAIWMLKGHKVIQSTKECGILEARQLFRAFTASSTITINLYSRAVLGHYSLASSMSNNIDYAERMWEEFNQSIHTFIEDKKNLAQHTQGKKKATLIVIPSVSLFLDISSLVLREPNQEVFGVPILNDLITDDIRGEQYYNAYLEKVAKHQRYLVVKEVSDPDSPAPKLALSELEQHMWDYGGANLAWRKIKTNKEHVEQLENLDIPISYLPGMLRDLPKADMKEIFDHRMWESNSYQAHEDHKMLYEALENSIAHDHTDQLLTDLAKARRKKKKRHVSPKTPPGSPPHQPPPPPPPAGSSGTPGASKASESS
ncbi:hypothetical protein Tco_0894551 [Tanacetum coccineum]|uniref:Uncharacterized protein n=1 Tax=Tanacetum coccineum TaxID=301880 RepID=A0ABQ5CID6_9ASTR